MKRWKTQNTIGVNCFLLKKNIGGMRQYFFRLFKELLDNHRNNQYVFFYFPQNKDEMEYIGNDAWKEHAVFLRHQHEIRSYIEPLDVYFCPFGALWPRPLPVPGVVTLVDIQEKYYPEFFSPQDILNRENFNQYSTRLADQVITISKFSKNSIANHLGIKHDKIHVAYLAADSSFFEPLHANDISLDLPDNFIFYPANRWTHKNHDYLLKALKILNEEKHLKAGLVLTGFDYKNGYPLEKKVKEYGLQGQVKGLGYITLQELRAVYRRARMLCFPSLFEGFGMPLVEAMASGCPVTCSNTTSVPEIVGEAGLLFNPHNPRDIAQKIFHLWENAGERERLIRLGKKQVKQFSIEKTAEKHLEVFERAVHAFSKSRYFFIKHFTEPLHSFKMEKKKEKLKSSFNSGL